MSLVRKVLGLQFSLKLVYNCKTSNYRYIITRWGDTFLFSIFLFVLRYELYLYHWRNLLLYPRSFIICFIRRADTTHYMWKTGYHKMNVFIQPRVLFLLLHACDWAAEETAAGSEGRLLTLMSLAETVVWLKNVIVQLFNFKPSTVSVTTFFYLPSSMINFHIKVKFEFSS